MKIILLLSLAALLCLSACQPAPAKHYPIQGEVISVDPPKKLLTVKHGEIPGLMPAMTMSYVVLDEKDIQPLKPGDKINADLVVSENKGQLEKIVLISHATGDSTTPPAK